MWLFLLSPVLLEPLRGTVRGLDALYTFNLVASVLWAGMLHFAARRPFALHLALAPLYVTTAVDLFLIFEFGDRLSSGFAYVALTEMGESSDFFATYAKPVLFIAAILACVYVTGLVAIRRLHLRHSRKASLACAVILALVYVLGLVRDSRAGIPLGQALLDLQAKEMSAPVGGTFQIGLALEIVDKSKEMKRRRNEFSFAAHLTRSDDDEIYVWIVGESSRPQDWSLFGYQRDTTPRLHAMSGIIPLLHMLTTAPQTSVAVPSMMSLRPITDWNSILAEHSIVSAFNEVGFKTYWLSAQEADSWGGFVPVVAAEAGHRRYFDRALDGALLDEFRKCLNAAPRGQRLFFVLHTKGSHFEYSRRYPPEFALFKSAHATRREQLVDAYDNSVLYTDWLVSEVIETLAKRNAASALIYASDHGENLLDTPAQLLGHIIGNQYDLPTAALIWLSPLLRARFPETAATAAAHADAKLSLSNLPHSLLDLAGIEAKGLDRSQSIFSPGLVTKERWYIVRGDLRHESSITAAR